MLKRAIIVLVLVATVALPFLLRPRLPSAARADDTLVLVSPHNEAIRYEFSLGFQRWYTAKTGRTVYLDWRNVGGTSDIARYLAGQYDASFRYLWTQKLGRIWSAGIQAAYKAPHLPADASQADREARAEFLKSDVGCDIDVFFGGGPYDFGIQARAGRLVDSGLHSLHPEWFTDATFPETVDGERYRDAGNLWFGTVLSSYGILYNKDALQRLGFEHPPEQWSDLTDPRYFGEVALCDPTQSGSIAAAFENVIQQRMHRRLLALRAAEPALDVKTATARAVRQGWIDGLRLLQLAGANARYFTDTSQKPPIDVAAGDCAVGMCIDFYGREQQEAVRRRSPHDRLGYVSPEGGSAYSVDPIALLRGAPHQSVAVAFIEFVLSLDGQKLWNFRTGTPGGPERFALRRLPVRKDFYDHQDWSALRSDPEVNPYAERDALVHHDEWTAALFVQMEFIIRVMDVDTHPELARAWKAVIHAPPAARAKALQALQDLSAVDYDQALGRISKAIASKNKVEAVTLARDLGDFFRGNYGRAERFAAGRD
jgi:ABC-type Fe3+ transport system substrate-binding protein